MELCDIRLSGTFSTSITLNAVELCERHCFWILGRPLQMFLFTFATSPNTVFLTNRYV